MIDYPLDRIDAYFDQHADRFLGELGELLRIPSVSTRPEHRADVARAADWLAAHLRSLGLQVTVHRGSGHPVVVGEFGGAAEGAPTVAVYGHYDVQPTEPLDAWESPPFEPAVRAGRLYARGSTDDKGQLFVHVKALEAWLAVHGRSPVNLIFLIEGEEESGGDGLARFLEQSADRLRCDFVLVSDSAFFAPGLPSLLTSLRGIAYFELVVSGPATDLHSGSYGGAVVNPATALARILASLHDDRGRVAVPGFYDRCREWPAELRREVAELPFDEAAYRAEAGVDVLAGEQGYSTLERLWMRPACDVNGLLGGYTGDGTKTVIPSSARAKLSCRLVAGQDPLQIEEAFRRHFRRACPPGVEARLTMLHGAPAWHARLDGGLLEAARRAVTIGFGRQPVLIGDGASIPVVAHLERHLDAPALLLGFGMPGENAHAPNEWLDLDNFARGLRTVASLWQELAALPRGESPGRRRDSRA